MPAINIAHGNAGDIIVVMSNDRWNSEAGNALKLIFEKEIETLPMEETLFDLHQIQYDKFNNTVNNRHKNIIYLDINPAVDSSNIKIIKNKYALNQVFVLVVAKDVNEFVRIVTQYQRQLVKLFLDGDCDRFIQQSKKYNNPALEARLKEKFDISLTVPKKFQVATTKSDFEWFSFETKTYTQNLIVYKYPLTDTAQMTSNFVIEMRNEFLKKYIPGENEGSYMTTETRFEYPEFQVIKHKNAETAIMHGLWRVKGDFMGGPFVSYTKIDKRRNVIVCVEGFVYYPNHETRDILRELEFIISTFDFIF
jgi:hypothetical protein